MATTKSGVAQREKKAAPPGGSDEVRVADGIPPELTRETLLDMYWGMLRARRLDERAWVLHRQGKIAFHISGMGHEATQVGAAFGLRRGHDYLAPYYRDLALMLAFGLTPREFVLGLFGKAGEPSSGAHQMPSHWGLKRANVISTSSPVATQVPHAAGIALGIKLRGDDRVALASIGEGSTSQGEWYEALNWAAVHRLPMICLVQNNVYAISVPIQKQMAVPNVADRAAAFGMPGVVVDGNDALAVYRVIKEAADRARSGGGPTLVEAKTYRPVPHSSDDDDRSYRSREEVEQWKARDPIQGFKAFLEAQRILTPEIQDEVEARATAEVEDAVKFGQEAPYPSVEAAMGPVYAEDRKQ